jgi:hypothetical protein
VCLAIATSRHSPVCAPAYACPYTTSTSSCTSSTAAPTRPCRPAGSAGPAPRPAPASSSTSLSYSGWPRALRALKGGGGGAAQRCACRKEVGHGAQAVAPLGGNEVQPGPGARSASWSIRLLTSVSQPTYNRPPTLRLATSSLPPSSRKPHKGAPLPPPAHLRQGAQSYRPCSRRRVSRASSATNAVTCSRKSSSTASEAHTAAHRGRARGGTWGRRSVRGGRPSHAARCGRQPCGAAAPRSPAKLRRAGMEVMAPRPKATTSQEAGGGGGGGKGGALLSNPANERAQLGIHANGHGCRCPGAYLPA